MIPVRDDYATARCRYCDVALSGRSDQQFCSTEHRQKAWRQLNSAPVAPVLVVPKSDTVYECPECGARLLGEQRCRECNTWCRRIGPGGLCPCCDEPISVTEILDPEQFVGAGSAKKNARR